MKIENTRVVKASPEACWKTLAEDFGQIAYWSSGVARSEFKSAQDDGKMMGGVRVCDIPGFGTLQETITDFDEPAMTIGYIIDGMPSMVRTAKNTWYVHPAGDDQALVGSIFDMDLSFLGKVMSPMLKMRLGGGTDKLLEEFATYVETGQLHDRTLKAKDMKAA